MARAVRVEFRGSVLSRDGARGSSGGDRAGRRGSGDLCAHTGGSQRAERVSGSCLRADEQPLPSSLGNSASQSARGGWDGCRTPSRGGSTRGTDFGVISLAGGTRRSWLSRETASGRCSITSTSIRCGRELLRRRMASNRMFGAVCPTISGLRASGHPGWKRRRVSKSADATIRPVDGGSFSACWSGGWTGAIPVGLGRPFPRAMASRSWRCIQVCGGDGCSVRSTSARSCSGVLAKRPTRIEKANGYHGPQLNDYAEKRARGAHSSRLGTLWHRSGDPATGSQGRLAQRADCGDDSERNYHETGLDYGSS